MNNIILVRIVISIVILCIIILLFKLHKTIKLEKRISRYSLAGVEEDISYFDKLEAKYLKLVKNCKNNK